MASVAASIGCASAVPSARAHTAAVFGARKTQALAAPLEPTVSASVAAARLDEAKAPPVASVHERCPAEMALVDGRVCVDRWEASLLECLPNGVERPWSPFVKVDGAEGRVRAVSLAGVVPQGYISGRQAGLACVASGKRLCRAAEWETACRGPEHSQFPYGVTRRAGVCNDDGRSTHPVPEAGRLLGLTGSAVWSDGMNEPIINQLPNTLLPTGAREACTNGFGVFDMVGNLHEWVDDGEDGDHAHGSHGTFRGGYYMDTSKNGEGCSYATTAHDFSYHDYSTGFRCCMDPEREG